MNEMVERVARAIAGQSEGELDPRWYRKARAGLEAMRIPTVPMLRAISEEGAYAPEHDAIICEQFAKMIDAALIE